MEDLLTVKQVAILLKVHQLTVRRYINEGKLKAIKAAGNIRISQNELNNFMQSFMPNAKTTKIATATTPSKPFTPSDPLFRLKARGLSLDKF
jgi:excisionase family DNA binding protein